MSLHVCAGRAGEFTSGYVVWQDDEQASEWAAENRPAGLTMDKRAGVRREGWMGHTSNRTLGVRKLRVLAGGHIDRWV